ncbi:MAG: YggS family pyridoxal phosphate-dependent enzyme [Fibrobacter sp.]|nr:YggS family pyridoxal phosphate-dependent enzyme [Fibrobacter sp.]
MSDMLSDRIMMVQKRIADSCKKVARNPDSVRLIVVTKTHPATVLQQVIDSGIQDLGENRVQEILEKVPHLSGNFTMHLIGHLQTNKVNKVLPYIRWIHSIDRQNLIEKIEQHHSGEKIKALVEVNTSGESSKNGCLPDQCRALCERILASRSLELRGLMTIGPLHGTETETRAAFSLLRKLAESNSDLLSDMELSMGMSGDYEWAVEEGSTMVRIGSLLLGERN